MSAGIDYSGPGGTCNRDPNTGIRYGVIPLHRLGEGAYDAFTPEYDARCPHCSAEIPEETKTTNDAGADCSSCERYALTEE